MNKLMTFREIAETVRCHTDTLQPILEDLKIGPVHITSSPTRPRKYYDREQVLQHMTVINEKIKARRQANKQSREKLQQNLAKGRAVLAAKIAAEKQEAPLPPRYAALIGALQRIEQKIDWLVATWKSEPKA